MDIESLRRMQLAKIDQQSRDNAKAEVEWLNTKYQGQDYTFECEGGQVTARFLKAESGSQRISGIPNSYKIVLVADASVRADGQAWIKDSSGKRLGASATTSRVQEVNRITLETLAVP